MLNADNGKNYHAQNLETIVKLRDKKIKEQEEKQAKLIRELELKNKLKTKILNDAMMRKEEEKKNVQSNREEKLIEKLNETRRIYNADTTFSKPTAQSLLKKSERKSEPKIQQPLDREKILQQAKEANQRIVENQRNYIEYLRTKRFQEKIQQEEEESKKEKFKINVKKQVLSQLSQTTQITTAEDLKKIYLSPETQNLDALDCKKLIQSTIKRPLKTIKEEDPAQRLQRKYPFISDLKQWKKKMRLDESVKVFIIMGGYDDLRNSLIKRGWIENHDCSSLCFDYKFTLQARDIDYNSLQDFQMVNHFQKNNAITTKVGLCKNLKNLPWFETVNIDSFYPRCYDLSDDTDYEDFILDFKVTKAFNILKVYLMMAVQKDKSGCDQLQKKAETALKVCQKTMTDINDILDDQGKQAKVVTQKEWEILSSDDLSAQDLVKKKYEIWQKRVEEKKKTSKKDEEDKDDKEFDDYLEMDQEDPFNKEVNERILNDYQIQTILKIRREKDLQYYINGVENIWIIKPAGLSRGRGIKCFQNLVEIEDHVSSKEAQWIIQKYIEKPLIIKKRKMDIRQWVILSDINPLTIWYYDECYLRFTAEDYDAKDLYNQFCHLTNNSVAKKTDQDQVIPENMWFESDFVEFLKDQNDGIDIFNEKIKPQMKQIVIWSLQSVQDQITPRKNTHEMLGYDFMIDDNYGVWLIEVNSSPAMDYSTRVTERLVKEGLTELPKVVVDHKNKESADTGKYTCIYKSNCIVDKPNTLALNLLLEGKKIHRK